MAAWLKQSTAYTFQLGPFLDKTDGNTPEAALTIAATDVDVSKAGAAYANKTDATALTGTGDSAGYYDCVLDATDTGTLGTLDVRCHISADALAVFRNFVVLPSVTYDALVAGSENLKVDTIKWNSCAVVAPTIAGVPVVDLTTIHGTSLTETSGQLAGSFIKFFDVAAPTATALSLPDAVPGAAGGGFIAGSNAATSVTTALTANITGNLSGSVGSVTGAVGSVTGAVGSVAGNVDGSVASVVGAVGSVTGAVGSVTGAVGSVTGAVGSVAGNVDGSTASVTGAVGSVTGAVGSVGAGGIAAATFAAGAIDAAAIAAAAIDNATFAADVGSTAYATNIIALAVRKALDEIKLDHLVAVADADDVVDDSIIAKMSSLAGTADWSAFDNTTDSLQAIRDRGDAAWTTGGGTGLTALGSGTAQSGTTSTIVLAAASAFPTASLNGNVINLHAGTGAGQSRVILSNTLGDDTCNIYPPWAVDPDATSEYEIVQGSTNLAAITSSGTAADNLLLIADRTFSVTTEVAVSDTALSFTLTDGGAADDAYNDMTISVQNGAGDGRWESRRISDWTSGKVVTVDSAFSFTPGGLDSVVIWNNRACSEGGGGGSSSITDITAAALAQFFTVDSTKDFSADAVAGSVVKEIASNCSALGAGAITDTFTVTVSGAPVANCSVWVTSDQAGTAVIVSGTANSSGVVTFSLDVATGYWVWAAIAGYTFASFSPAEFDVASGGFSWA